MKRNGYAALTGYIAAGDARWCVEISAEVVSNWGWAITVSISHWAKTPEALPIFCAFSTVYFPTLVVTCLGARRSAASVRPGWMMDGDGRGQLSADVDLPRR